MESINYTQITCSYALGYRVPRSQQTMVDGSDSDPELQEAIHRSLNEDSHSLSLNPQHNRRPIGFEHLESEARHDHAAGGIGFEHLVSETGNGNDIGFEQLNREEPSNIRYRPHGTESSSRQMSAEQLRAARIARFERSSN